MTKFLDTYSFMDLLKDYDYVPETGRNEPSIFDNIENILAPITDFVKASAYEYDFMDLLNDKGYVTANSANALVASNDNDLIVRAAS
ncbi:MAG: hypothetical protein R3D86_09525 [Emcibacteraceae bacterium]